MKIINVIGLLILYIGITISDDCIDFDNNLLKSISENHIDTCNNFVKQIHNSENFAENMYLNCNTSLITLLDFFPDLEALEYILVDIGKTKNICCNTCKQYSTTTATTINSTTTDLITNSNDKNILSNSNDKNILSNSNKNKYNIFLITILFILSITF